jgi:hypothetical protein
MDRVLKSTRESGSLNLSNRALRSTLYISDLFVLDPIQTAGARVLSSTGLHGRSPRNLYDSNRIMMPFRALRLLVWYLTLSCGDTIQTQRRIMHYHQLTFREIPNEVYNNLGTASQDDKWWEVNLFALYHNVLYMPITCNTR